MVTMLLVARGSQRVAFVDDQEGAPRLAGRLNDFVEGLGQEGPHLAHLAATSDPVAQLEKQCILSARLLSQSVCNALSGSRLASSHVAVEDHKRVLLSD